MAENQDRLTLVDEEGQEHAFSVLDVLEIDENRYAVLLPDADPEAGAVILRIETDENDDEILLDIEDDEEFERVIEFLDADTSTEADDE